MDSVFLPLVSNAFTRNGDGILPVLLVLGPCLNTTDNALSLLGQIIYGIVYLVQSRIIFKQSVVCPLAVVMQLHFACFRPHIFPGQLSERRVIGATISCLSKINLECLRNNTGNTWDCRHEEIYFCSISCMAASMGQICLNGPYRLKLGPLHDYVSSSAILTIGFLFGWQFNLSFL